MPTSTKMNAEEESAELRQFREQWKKEVRHRREEQQVQPQGATAEPSQHKVSSPEPYARSHASPRAAAPETEVKPPTTGSVPGASHQALHMSHGQSPLSGSIARAVEIYRSAVQHEQESDLDEALRLYRQAFRLNPDVDRAYFKEEQQLGRSTVGTGHKKTTSTSRGEGTEGKDSHITEGKEAVHMHGILSKVLEKFPELLTFEPENDREGVAINMIPEELLLYILRNLDTMTLERFATVSRRARVLSLDPSIWRYGHP
jgi:F-box protein 9